MKCKHCDYENGYDVGVGKEVKGKDGKFYTLPIKMERNEHFDDQTEAVYGCPKCGKLFMDVYRLN